MKLSSCHAIEKIRSDWHVISFARNVRPSQPHKSEDVDTTVWLRCRSRAGPGVPIPQRCAVATRPHFGFSGCTPAAEEGPCLVMERVEVWTIWRPKGRRDEVWCLALEQIDRLLCAVNNKLWHNFWRHYLQRILSMPHFKTANQQHQQNPVNELSCTNLYSLVCFLRTNICSFFMIHDVFRYREQKCTDTIGTVPVPWDGHFQR